jgi:hypothetical protein
MENFPFKFSIVSEKAFKKKKFFLNNLKKFFKFSSLNFTEENFKI